MICFIKIIKNEVRKLEIIKTSIEIPENVHLAFKSECAKYRGLNMNSVLADLIVDWLTKRGVDLDLD